MLTTLVGGAGAPGGGAAGDGTGVDGANGVNGEVGGGGLFSQTGTANVGNSIIALNQAATNLNNVPPGVGAPMPTSNQVGFGPGGTIVSQGNNLIGVLGPQDSTAFTQSGDQTGVTAAQLNLGPLQLNGGPTPTDGLLNGSVAIAAGNVGLANAAGLTTDQRGLGFPRFDPTGTLVDVGAFELQLPVITGFNPNPVLEGSGPLALTINGTGFTPGAMVNFGGTVLTPTSVSQNQIIVTIPAPLLNPNTDISGIPVFVTVPDASGLTPPGTIMSATVDLPLAEPPVLPVNNPGSQTNNEGDVLSGATALTITSPDFDANSFTDLVAGVHTLPPGLTISGAGVITGTIDPRGEGVYTVTITALDDGTSGSATFTWTVNDTTPPTLSNPGTQTNKEGDTVTAITITATDADPGTFTDVVAGVHTLPPGLSIDPTSGKITGTLTSHSGLGSPYTVTISATDNGHAGSVSFTWNVNAVPPTVTAPANQTNNESDSVSGVFVTATGADPGTFSDVVAGVHTLPLGLSIDPNTGQITGTIGRGTRTTRRTP